jgi:hypothetical protein
MGLVASVMCAIYAVLFLGLTPRLSPEFLGLVTERLAFKARVVVASHDTLSIVGFDAADTAAHALLASA